MPRLLAIAAMAENRAIGRDGGLPWRLPEDLRFFKETTMGGAILFGRTTFEGIGRPLPGRTNLVLSRQWDGYDGVEVVHSLDELRARHEETIFVCGGAEIYQQLFPFCEGLYLTRVLKEVEGDTVLPAFEHLFQQKEVLREGEGYQIEFWERPGSPDDL